MPPKTAPSSPVRVPVEWPQAITDPTALPPKVLGTTSDGYMQALPSSAAGHAYVLYSVPYGGQVEADGTVPLSPLLAEGTPLSPDVVVAIGQSATTSMAFVDIRRGPCS